jgi:hypothetical protein
MLLLLLHQAMVLLLQGLGCWCCFNIAVQQTAGLGLAAALVRQLLRQQRRQVRCLLAHHSTTCRSWCIQAGDALWLAPDHAVVPLRQAMQG